MLQIDSNRMGEVSAHVAADYPNESCGLLIGSVRGDLRRVARVLPATNRNHARAGDRYDLDPADFRRADALARTAGAEIVGIYHSHPDHPCRPSAFDTERAWEGYSYLILSVTAAGVGPYRSWVLDRGAFREEPVAVPEPPTEPPTGSDPDASKEGGNR